MLDEIQAVTKGVAKAKRTTDALSRAKPDDDLPLLSLLDKTIDAVREVSESGLIETLEESRNVLKRRVEDKLAARREALHGAAADAGWPARRLQKYDRVDCFKVQYRRARVTLHLGSEKLDTFDETDGAQLFARIRETKAKLDNEPFARAGFFAAVKAAIALAKALGKDRDGKTPIRTLYPLVVLARQAGDSAFMKQPHSKKFRNYSMCQFIYDMARFGRDGWYANDRERLASQTPNMATIGRGAALTLPDLAHGGAGHQLALLWIEKTRRAAP